MTLGNKWLMLDGALATHKHLVLILQNGIAVAVLATLSAMRIMSVGRVDARQLLFYCWDAIVLVVQLYTSFMSLHHLPVAATTVVRALAIPLVAWSEWLLLGSRLDVMKLAASWVVLAGALLYAHEDVLATATADSADAVVGYCWAGLNLLAYVSNSVLDRVMMSTSSQSAGGMAMYTQAISIPICWSEGALFHSLSFGSARALLLELDRRSAAALAVTGMGAALLSSCFAQCYKRASATTVTIAGNVNRAVAVLLSVLLFGTRPSPRQLAGLAVCLGGAFAYSLAGARQKAAGLKE